ncbi:MAG: DNA-binding protein WhiA [Defluviitaleaceae bacterium]|nr:DNA-binding protein WhiA [Defluviitaleaceae bacterium]
MSFSSEIKDELIHAATAPKHCLLAEIAAFLTSSGQLSYTNISVSTDNKPLIKRFASLAQTAFARAPSVSSIVAMPQGCRRAFSCSVSGNTPFITAAASALQDESLLLKECCKRAYIRGAFLSSGSASNPENHYHLEFAHQDKSALSLLHSTILHFDIDMRATQRKSSHILYVKDAERIAWLLNIMGAHKSLMNLENVRILKDVRNITNRRVNFETANISKTVDAAVSQQADIKYILESGQSRLLSKNLADVANLRLAYPTASLQEIGDMLSPAISKSAVNHRLRKISALAEKLRGDRT